MRGSSNLIINLGTIHRRCATCSVFSFVNIFLFYSFDCHDPGVFTSPEGNTKKYGRRTPIATGTICY